MNKFIDELAEHLGQLSVEERQDAVEFYSEYLQDGNFTEYDDAVKELGTPKQLARKILADYSIKESDAAKDSNGQKKKPKSDVKTIWLIILALLSTPVTIPLAIGLVAAGFGVIIGILGIIFAFVMILGSLIILAGIAIFAGITVLSAEVWTGIYYLGMGLAILGLFVVAVPIGKWLIDLLVHWTSVLSKWVYEKVVPKNRAEKRGNH